MPDPGFAPVPLRLVPTPAPENLDEAVHAFATHLVAAGRSPLTISAYRRDLGTFGRVLACRFPGAGPVDLTPAMLDAVLSDPGVTTQADGRPRSPGRSSVSRRRCSRSVAGWPRRAGPPRTPHAS